MVVRQNVLRIFNFASVFFAEFLTKLNSPGRAILNASSASNTFICLNTGNISRAGKIRGVKKLTRSERVADVHVAVTDGKNLVLAVNIRNLVNKSVVLGVLQDFHDFFAGNVMTAFSLHEIISHIANANAPIFRVVGTAFIKSASAQTARARRSRVFSVVFVEPVRNVLN